MAEDCHYIVDMVVVYAGEWVGVVKGEMERIEEGFAVAAALPRRTAEQRRQELGRSEYVKIGEFTCRL